MREGVFGGTVWRVCVVAELGDMFGGRVGGYVWWQSWRVCLVAELGLCFCCSRVNNNNNNFFNFFLLFFVNHLQGLLKTLNFRGVLQPRAILEKKNTQEIIRGHATEYGQLS